MNRQRTAAWLVLSSACLTVPVSAQTTIRVSSGDRDRTDALVTLTLPAALRDATSLRLQDVSSGKQTPVPAQVDSATNQLWFVAEGKIPAGEKRTYRLERGANESASQVALIESDNTIE